MNTRAKTIADAVHSIMRLAQSGAITSQQARELLRAVSRK